MSQMERKNINTVRLDTDSGDIGLAAAFLLGNMAALVHFAFLFPLH